MTWTHTRIHTHTQTHTEPVPGPAAPLVPVVPRPRPAPLPAVPRSHRPSPPVSRPWLERCRVPCEQLTAETTCPLCLDMLVEPVLTACGHSFCRRCLATVLGYPPHSAACPQCRAAVQPRPSRTLGNVAGLARALEELAGRPPCPQHAEPLALFCMPCAALICTVCRDGSEHQQHRVLPAEVAAPELRETLQRNLLFLQNEKERLKLEGDWKSFVPMWTVIWDTQHVAKTFDELQKFVKEQQKILLGQLNELSRELVKKWDGYNSRILERRLLLDTTIAKIQEKQDQRVIKFLMDVDKILNRCEAARAPIPQAVFPELQRSVQSISEIIQVLVDMVAKFRVNLQREVDGDREKVTLDPETAGPFVALSQDCKTIRCRDGNQNLPDISKKFTSNAAVLGSQGFTSGRHYWEVEVEKEKAWAVGVAVGSLPRKEPDLTPPCKEIWALRRDCDGQYKTDRVPPDPLKVTEQLWMIRVHLDHDVGQVTFYNAENMKQIVPFRTTFPEKVFPYFCLYAVETQLQLCD